MREYHVYGIGAALVDTEIEVTDQDLEVMQVEKSLMTLVDEARQQELISHLEDHLTASKRASGGSAANSIIAVSQFGGKAFYSCQVADDENGHFYLQDLTAAGVSYPNSRPLPQGTSGKCLVLITPDAERSMNTFLGISETLSVDNLDYDAIADSQYLYVEGYVVTSDCSRQAFIAARKAAEAAGTKTALSLSDPGIVDFFKEGLQEMIGEQVDLLFCNEAEAMSWTGADNLGDAATGLQAIARSFAITLGSEGALVYDGSQLHRMAPYPVTAVDTNGAGDMFAGAFIYALSQGYSHAQAGDLACAAASAIVGQFGPRLHQQQHHGILAAFKEPLHKCK